MRAKIQTRAAQFQSTATQRIASEPVVVYKQDNTIPPGDKHGNICIAVTLRHMIFYLKKAFVHD